MLCVFTIWLCAGGLGGFLLAALLAATQGDLSLMVVEVDERKRRLAERLGAAEALLYLATASFCSGTILNISGGNVRAVMC